MKIAPAEAAASVGAIFIMSALSRLGICAEPKFRFISLQPCRDDLVDRGFPFRLRKTVKLLIDFDLIA